MPLFRHARVRRTGGRAVSLTAVSTALLGAVALTALTAVLPASRADAATSRTVAGGRLDWGIKASFQSYVTGPIAKGSWAMTGGAGTFGSNQFRFPSARGSYDPGSGALTAAFAGGVHFLGHRQASGAYQLDLTISRPTVKISGGHGTLYADMRSKDKNTGRVTTTAQVPLASLAVGGVNTRGVTGPQITLSGIPATLTSQGARAFAGYYTTGTPLDPVSLSVDLRAPASPTTAPPRTPTGGASDKASGKPTATSTAVPGTVVDAAADWGVRRTFREYVTGDIAKGRWTVADGARDGGALFRFGAGRGTYDASHHSLDARFGGTVRFVGMKAADGTYGLDLSISAVRVTVTDGKGTLYADGEPFITFTAPAALAPKNGLISLTEVPTTLTAQGAKAFNGLYTAGTSMDPLTLSVALDKAAALPALPDIGSDPTASATPAASPAPSTAPAAPRTESAADSSHDGAPVGLLAGGSAAVLAAAAVVFAVVRRKRRTEEGG
ncbi:HtaA domain-containing protein [Streptomyces sp. NPDC003300]|uniref:HtaA domain-containing protein n=1 Tax=unclassified Streptomyces TaxID=2593676 RepID=UPI0033ABF25C